LQLTHRAYADKLFGQSLHAINASIAPSIVEMSGAAIDQAKLNEALAKCPIRFLRH
jgi:hypothetical protein